MPDVSCQHQFRRLRRGIEPENLFAFGFQQELNGFPKVAQTFFFGLSQGTMYPWSLARGD